MNVHVKGIVPFSLKDAPSLIEKAFSPNAMSYEAKKERDAKQGQTLSVLGAYWKGRKPLILVQLVDSGTIKPVSGHITSKQYKYAFA
ncbi:DUF1156 domain-containing protein [Aurantimonas sp. A2-1-M11]|uniref:DUF1156 domain-containing protein n=1 Tax=Aurantimonas sp. A2-1-M11 TaxID=3113712 RepID=UPI002F936BCB